MPPVIAIRGLSKTYASGLEAVRNVDLDIAPGEIFALLGPNGAGKTTLISMICGIVTMTAGKVVVDRHDIVRDYRRARAKIGLVPQELTTSTFESVWDTVTFSRGLFGRPPDPDYIERLLRDLSLDDKRDAKLLTLSGGMKRRVMIAKALSHEPSILFLDEPTAGVDVELRRDMWALVRRLRDNGVTIVLTTHYIEEAEQMADRVGVIRAGEMILTEETGELLERMGQKQLSVQLERPLTAIPDALSDWPLALNDRGDELEYHFDAHADRTGISTLLQRMGDAGIGYTDLRTRQSSLEEIFVDLVREPT